MAAGGARSIRVSGAAESLGSAEKVSVDAVPVGVVTPIGPEAAPAGTVTASPVPTCRQWLAAIPPNVTRVASSSPVPAIS